MEKNTEEKLKEIILKSASKYIKLASLELKELVTKDLLNEQELEDVYFILFKLSQASKKL